MRILFYLIQGLSGRGILRTTAKCTQSIFGTFLDGDLGRYISFDTEMYAEVDSVDEGQFFLHLTCSARTVNIHLLFLNITLNPCSLH